MQVKYFLKQFITSQRGCGAKIDVMVLNSYHTTKLIERLIVHNRMRCNKNYIKSIKRNIINP